MLVFLGFYHAVTGGNKLIAQTITGRISDNSTHAPLAFVSIGIEGEPQRSAMSDIDGNFSISPGKLPAVLVFSYLGYEKFSLRLDESKNNLNVQLHKSSYELKEVEIKAGENPANRIIRKTWQTRAEHDAEALPFYTCSTYNKLILTGKKDSLYKAQSEEDKQDAREADSLFEKQHLFMVESVNKRYKRGDKVKEEVLGSLVSGFEEASIFMLALKFQPFTLYAPLIELSGKQYVNPISRNSEALYFFSLEDTLFNGADTTYIISFHPRKGKTFNALEGTVYIQAPDYALRNVIADPIDADSPTPMNIRQQYTKLPDGHWFPEQIITTLEFKTVNLPGSKLVGVSKTYVSEVDLKTEVPRNKFDENELEVLDSKTNRDSSFWKAVRIDELTAEEKRTYDMIDSLFKAEKIETKFRGFQYLIQGFIPIKWFNLDLYKLMRFNQHEGFRLGAGGITNDRLSKRFALGGYGAYGFRDKVFKYGGEVQVFLHRNSELTLRLAYQNDIAESGQQQLLNARKPTPVEQYRNFLVNRFDAEEKTYATLSFRSMKFLKTDVFGGIRHVSPLYNYAVNSDFFSKPAFYLAGNRRFVYLFVQAEFYKNGNLKIPLSTPFPVIYAQVIFGEDLAYKGSFTYTRVDLSIEHKTMFRRLGKLSWQIRGGYIDGTVPYANLFNVRSNYRKKNDLPAVSENTMESFSMNSYASDRYAALFLQHNLGYFFKIKKFKPSIMLYHNAWWGDSRQANTVSMSWLDYKTPDVGLFEAGLGLNELVRLNSVGYGVAGFYRYGASSDANWKKNVFIKLSLGIGFN
ncbi:MAG: DUF5686 family protein [Bacteroidia bacterium]